MSMRLLIPISVAMLAASMPALHAASCSDDIDRTQARVDAMVESIAAAGPNVPPGIGAGMGVQPTPLSMAVVEEKMGEISRKKVGSIRQAMAQARAANSAGKYKTCEQALARVRRAMHPSVNKRS